MRTLLVLLQFYFPQKDSCRMVYLNEVLFPKENKEYYLVVNARQEDSVFKILISNIRFKQILKRNKIELDECIKKGIISNSFILDIHNDDDVILTNINTNSKAELDKILSKGKQYFINFFFDDHGAVRPRSANVNAIEVFEQIFKWNIFIQPYDSGLLILRKQFTCGK